jgi:hypothetical protein
MLFSETVLSKINQLYFSLLYADSLIIMLLIYLSKTSARCRYVLDLVFKEESGIEFRTTNDVREFEVYTGEKLNYSPAKIANEFFIKASPFLFESEIKKQQIKVVEKDSVQFLFPNEDDDLGFDIFSAVFFMVSRYEEYLPFTPDEFGRFNAQDSLAVHNNFLHLPIVNIWIKFFQQALQKKCPSLRIKATSFIAILTYDIDVAFQFSGRSFGRTIGSVAKDLLSVNFKNIRERTKTLSKSKKDPWDVYNDLQKIILKNKLQSVFFFLLSDKTKHDRNLNYQDPVMKDLVNKIQGFSEIGIHPSFYSSIFPVKIVIEKERLEKISEKKITKSRQHYLKFLLPDTYNSLLATGITEDYSMGFSKMPGFRAGTCKPFYFYDLKNEKATDLKIFPITFMEGTLMDLKPGDALKKILELLKEVKNVGGTFIPLWHNHTISETAEYGAWKNVHDQMIEEMLLTLNDS